ncbi:MAG: heavy-metal-associated protein [Segetibacter sp.]|nr:heavy-metal-associated protein [Segetibacter sp.]
MIHTYNITGMTCNNCVAKVKSELLKIGEITSADIQLNAPQATLSMHKHVNQTVLQVAINKAGNYTITESGHQHPSSISTAPEVEKSWLLTYKPLLLVFTFITGISLVASWQNDFHLNNWMHYFMAGFFLAFSFFKLLDLQGFANSYSTYDVLAKHWRGYGMLYPFIELALGIAYLTQWNPTITNIATIVVMGFSAIGVIQSVLEKRKIKCACLGAVFNLPMSTVTIVEDLLMVAMAAAMLIL